MLLLYRLLKDLRPYIPLWKRWLLEVLLEVKQWNKLHCRYSVLLSKQLEKVCKPDFFYYSCASFLIWWNKCLRVFWNILYFQIIPSYQKKQLVFLFGVWVKTLNATSNGWVFLSRSLPFRVYATDWFFWIEQENLFNEKISLHFLNIYDNLIDDGSEYLRKNQIKDRILSMIWDLPYGPG